MPFSVAVKSPIPKCENAIFNALHLSIKTNFYFYLEFKTKTKTKKSKSNLKP